MSRLDPAVEQLDSAAIARRVARMRAELGGTTSGAARLSRALDDVGRSLDRLVRACGDDYKLASRLGEPRSMAASYVRASVHLTESGVASSRCEDVLRRGRARVIDELAEVQRALLDGDAD